jgi:hypothetical protein
VNDCGFLWRWISPESFVESLRCQRSFENMIFGAQQRLALQLLAGVPFGATEAAMFFNGFKRQTLVRLVRTGLATIERENVRDLASPAVQAELDSDLGRTDGSRCDVARNPHEAGGTP